MNWFVSFLLAVLYASFSYAFDCSLKELQGYDLQGLKGVYSATNSRNTPPSKTTIDWLIAVCEDLSLVSDCDKDADICGKKTIVNGDKSLLAEVYNFKYNPLTAIRKLGNNGDEGFAIDYDLVWGDDNNLRASMVFMCVPEKEATKEFESRWDNRWLTTTIKSDKACLKANRKPNPGSGNDNGESWGWFTWIFIFMVLFLSIYIIGGAWFQYNKGNAIDFLLALKEVLENFVDLLRGLPVFIKEIIEKFTRNGNRGEYSAV